MIFMTIKKKIVLTAVITAVATASVMGAAGYAVIYKTSSIDKFEKKISMINSYLEQGYIYAVSYTHLVTFTTCSPSFVLTVTCFP